MDKQRYLSEEESARCRMVADAFTELYELDDIAVVDAGRFGFVKLRYYTPDSGFDNIVNYVDSREMFEDLWEDWFDLQLLIFAKGTPMMELDYEDIFKCLPVERQEELMECRRFFAERAGLDIA